MIQLIKPDCLTLRLAIGRKRSYMLDITARPRLLSVTESVALPPHPSRRTDGKYSDDKKRKRTSCYVRWVEDRAG